MKTPKQLGAEGEDIAKKYFISLGFRFICRNFSFKHYEIDLIFENEKDKEIIFIEVKTRRSLKYGTGEEAIDSRKIEKLKNGAFFFIKLNPEFKNHRLRFDSYTILYTNGEMKTTHLDYSF